MLDESSKMKKDGEECSEEINHVVEKAKVDMSSVIDNFFAKRLKTVT